MQFSVTFSKNIKILYIFHTILISFDFCFLKTTTTCDAERGSLHITS